MRRSCLFFKISNAGVHRARSQDAAAAISFYTRSVVDEPRFWALGTLLSAMAFAGFGLRDVTMRSRDCSQAWRYGFACCLIQVTILFGFHCIPFRRRFWWQAIDPSMLNE